MPDRHSEENRLKLILIAMLPSGISADKIADGSVSNAEFQSLNGAPANIALSLDQKQPIHAILTGISALTDDGTLGLSGGLPVSYPLTFTGVPPASPVDGQLSLATGQQQLVVYSILQSAWVGAPYTQQIGRLAGPFPSSGAWFVGDGIGLSTSAESETNLDAVGALPMRAPKQRLSKWLLSIEHPDGGTDYDHEIYYKPVGGSWTASGILITILAGQSQGENSIDTLDLEEGDLVCVVLNSPSYSPGATVAGCTVQPIID